jgi:hypothetical protein
MGKSLAQELSEIEARMSWQGENWESYASVMRTPTGALPTVVTGQSNEMQDRYYADMELDRRFLVDLVKERILHKPFNKDKETVCLDFDGVIHPYTGWKGVHIFDGPPIEGSHEAIRELRTEFYVIVQSARAREDGGKEAIEGYLRDHNISVDGVTNHKPSALVYVDDRAFRFRGSWNEVLAFIRDGHHTPWNKSKF